MKNKRRVAKTSKIKSSTYEIDIAQEFKDVKLDFKDFKTELSNKLDKTNQKLDDWKTVFDRQLTQLNDNMKNVMDKIAQHEFRFTEHETRLKNLEDTTIKSETRTETMTNMAKFCWIVAKVALGVGAVLGTIGGGAWILKLLQVV